MKPFIVPVVLIVASIPMALGKVPRNGLYGFRTRPLLRCHSQRTIKANDFAIQHFILENVPDQRAVL